MCCDCPPWVDKCAGFPCCCLELCCIWMHQRGDAKREAKAEAKKAKEDAECKQVQADKRAEMRRVGVQSPPPMMMHGGVIRLTPDATGLFDWTPLPQHEDWLQDRLTREEWSELILSINDAAITDAIERASRWSSGAAPDVKWTRAVRLQGACSEANRIRADWLERGLDLLMPHATPARLYFKVVPVGSTPVNNAAGLGVMSGGAAAVSGPAASSMDGPTWTGTVASPPAYPADNAPPGGLLPSVPAVASVYAFPIVVKPAPFHSAAPSAASDSSSAEGQSSGAEGSPRPVWRVCPFCTAPIEPQNVGKSFCPECGGKWK